MQSGYVKVYRKALDKKWLSNHKLWVVWTYCLMKASYKKTEVIVGLQVIKLEPGQFVFGLKVASKDLKIPKTTIYRILKFLKSEGNLSIKAENKFSIITIMNWERYQDTKNQNGKQMENKRKTNGNIQEVKEVKNKEYSKDFLEFYSAYPLKKSKAKAYKAWKKLKPDLHTCLAALQSQMIEKGFLKAEKKFCPEWKHPSTWLNQQCWEDEVETEKKTEKVYV